MIPLSTSDAVELVRKNLDELDPNGNASVMYTDENDDNLSLSATIKRMLPEAINAVQLAAPATLLEGKSFDAGDLDSVAIENGVLSISLKSTTNFLRLVEFQAADSIIVVSDTIGEATPEGRKQLNPRIRGRYDRPRLVQLQGRHTGPQLKYYTLNTEGQNYAAYVSTPADAISRLSFVQEQFYAAATTEYNISRRLRQNIIDYLTAKVVETYSDQRAQAYYTKALAF